MSEASEKQLFGGIEQAFSDPNFRYYSIGAIATWIGFFVQLVAVSWYTWELTGSTTWLAIIALLDIVPNVVLMPLAGAIADRFDKYRIMGVVSSLALLQALLIALFAWLDQLTIGPLAALVFAHGVIISFMVPAMYGILPRFVRRDCLTSAIAVSSSYAQLAVFLGPAIAGWVIASYGVFIAFIINAAGYVIYLVSWWFLKTPDDFKKPVKSGKSVWADMKEGFHYIIAHRGISSLLMIMLVGDALGACVFYMAPAFSEHILGMGVIGVSIMLACKGVGATLAAFWLAYKGKKAATSRNLLRGYLFFVLSVFIIFLVDNIIVVILSLVILGVAAEMFNTILITLVQLSVTEEQRGRVMGTLFMLAQFASGIGTYVVGYFAVKHGLVWPTLTFATVCLLVWIFYFFCRKNIQEDFATEKAL